MNSACAGLCTNIFYPVTCKIVEWRSVVKGGKLVGLLITIQNKLDSGSLVRWFLVLLAVIRPVCYLCPCVGLGRCETPGTQQVPCNDCLGSDLWGYGLSCNHLLTQCMVLIQVTVLNFHCAAKRNFNIKQQADVFSLILENAKSGTIWQESVLINNTHFLSC